MKKDKIAFVIGKMTSGGAQRVIATLANLLIEKYEVTIVTTTKQKSFYELDPRINTQSCFESEQIKPSRGIWQSLKLNYSIYKRVKSILKKENIQLTIGFITQTNVFAILASKANKIPCLISERTNPKLAKIPKMWKILTKKFYPKADCIVVQTEAVKEHYSKLVNEEKIMVLPNPISKKLTQERKEQLRENIILNVGRLHWVKNQKLIIEAFANLNLKDWKLQIVGEGGKRKELLALVKEKNAKNIEIVGSKDNIQDYYNSAKIFAFTSFYEGFPNALLEAMHYGLTPVSTDCPSGPSELIENAKNGFLINNEDSLKELENCLKTLTENENLRIQMGISAKESTNKYKAVEVIKDWDKLIVKFLKD